MILGRNRRGSYGAVLSTAMDDARPTSAADVGGGDRFDETENRALGRNYLAHMYRRYGSWHDAIAAYNWGPGRLDEWINAPEICRPVARQRANTRLERFERLRMQAKRKMAERRRGGRGPDAVELLYSEIMHPPPPARLDAEIFRCNARYRIGRRPDPQVSPHTSSRGHNGKWTLDSALAGQNRGARNHRAGGALCAWRVCRIRVRKAVPTRCRSTD